MNKQREAIQLANEAWDNIDTTGQSHLECARQWFVEGYVQAMEWPPRKIKRLTEKEVEDILVKCVNPIDKGLHWDFKKLYEDLFEAITGEKA